MTLVKTYSTVIVSAALLLALSIFAIFLFRPKPAAAGRIAMAVEFTNHAAAAYIAQDKGWYKARAVNLSSYTSYATGMALSSALARGEIQVAYMCLAPAINAYANARVPLRIVAGTHKYGYALVVNPKRVSKVEELVEPGVRVGCVREGGAVDVLMNRAIDSYHLDREKMLGKVRRASPPKLLIAVKAGQLDAAFLPEHWASMAEDLGFRMLLTARDIWPGMQGSVLIVNDELIRDNPGLVRELVAVNQQATRWINANPEEAARALARVLSLSDEKFMLADQAKGKSNLKMSPEMMLRSMGRLEYTSAISLKDVQQVIEYTARLGYIEKSFSAERIVDTRYMR
ncbi:MAG: ABC transporter substrate-binding protein [Deltaproteobacteria bacterium]|nr:ABC transporter substrate-binding protein [Deltaproteobacteria bacterium]